MRHTIKNLLALLDEAGIPVQNPRSGIRWYRQTNRWQVVIKVDGVNHHIGYFQDLYEAVIAREAAELQHFPNGRPPKKPRKSQPEAVSLSPTVGSSVSQPEDDDDDGLEAEFWD